MATANEQLTMRCDMMRKVNSCFAVSAILLSISAGAANADGIDVAQFLMHTKRSYSSNAIAGMFLLSMTINYALNLIVIGLPARKYFKLTNRRAAVDTIWITVLGQATDRIGAILGLIISALISGTIGLNSLDEVGKVAYYVIPVVTWAVISGSIWIFAKFFWKINGYKVGLISLLAGILTNPVWANLILGI